MSKLRIYGDTSGYVDIQAPDVAGATTINTGDLLTSTASADSNEVLTLNRTSSDGDIAVFQKDGTKVGAFGIQSDGTYLDGESNSAGIRFGAGAVTPRLNYVSSDGTINLGNGSFRWSNLYLSGGVYLGGTTSANYLTEYEEGTWTPGFYVRGNRSQPVYTSYGAQYGRYVKIGKICHCHISLVGGTTKANNPGTDVAINLPFTATSLGDIQQGAQGFNYTSNFPALNDTYRVLNGFIDQNLDELMFRRHNINSDTDNVGCNELGSTAQVYMNFSYITKS